MESVEEAFEAWEREQVAKFGQNWHCDDWIEDPSAPDCVRKFLDMARGPAHGAGYPAPKPTLYADHAELGRVRVTMASRFGDVGITSNLNAVRGYDKRVMLAELSNFGEAA